MSLYFLSFVLFCVGLYGVLRKRNIIKIIISLGIIDYSINLFLILTGYRMYGRAPIFSKDQVVSNMVDPLPQALVLITISVGLAITIVLVSLAIRIYDKFGTFDITKIRRLKG
ncbi:MAG TPA: sodium:proton antiporter [Candidatus Margulisiibacteriota bacterium]|nr:sodium:proton antiporter [Candidatus Margulisiibacteriota bacterium]